MYFFVHSHAYTKILPPKYPTPSRYNHLNGYIPNKINALDFVTYMNHVKYTVQCPTFS